MAASPKSWSFSEQRRQKSEREWSQTPPARHARLLAENPFYPFILHQCLPRHFTRYLVETLDRIHYSFGRFNTFTKDSIDRESRNVKLLIYESIS